MDRLIYTSLTGMTARARAQGVTANNLANAATTGFRREIVAAEGRYVIAAPATSRAQAGAPSVTTPREAGPAGSTGRALDIALAGDAWLAVQGATVAGRPTEAYTRRGDLAVTASGLLQLGDGRVALNTDGTPVSVPPGAELTIATDGSLSARSGETVTPLGQLKLVAGAGLNNMDKSLDGMFTTKSPLTRDPLAQLRIGELEQSNVRSTAALTELVEQSRGFEVNARLLGIAKDIDEHTARLMSPDAN